MWKCLWLLLMVLPEPAEINGRFIEITPLRKHTHAMDAGIMFRYLNQVNEEREVQEISARNVIFQLSNYALLNMNYAFGLWIWFIFMLINGHLIIYQHWYCITAHEVAMANLVFSCQKWSGLIMCRASSLCTGRNLCMVLTLMLVVANLADTKWCKKKPEKWLILGTSVLICEYSARAIQWIPTWQGLDGFQKSLRLWLSIGRVRMMEVKMWNAGAFSATSFSWIGIRFQTLFAYLTCKPPLVMRFEYV